MINKFCLLIFSAVLSLATASAFAQDYSADMVGQKSDHDGSHGKIYVSGQKIRFESTREGGHGGAMIWNVPENKRVVLMPERKMYMDLPVDIPALAFAFWQPTDIENACPQWEKLAQQLKSEDKISSCHKVGPDIVNGRPAVKYEGTSSAGKSSQVWLDARLRSVIKVTDSEGGGMEMQNIQEGSQPASLFEIPSDYQKFDMGAMKNRQH
jgi:hypothetical protein